MDIAPLALVVLLGYGLLIAVSLTTWTAVTYFREDTSAASPLQEPRRTRVAQERPRDKPAVSNDDVRGARSRRTRSGSDPFQGEAKPAPAGEGPASGRSATVTWKPETGGVAKRPASKDASNEEDAFERFLSSRSDDFDIR